MNKPGKFSWINLALWVGVPVLGWFLIIKGVYFAVDFRLDHNEQKVVQRLSTQN